MTAYAPILGTGNGSNKDFPFTWPYLKQAHVKVSLDGVASSAFEIVTGSTVRMDTAPANGVVVKVYRETPTEPVTVWQDGAVILGADLNAASKQSLYIAEEARAAVGGDIATLVGTATAAASSAAASAAQAATSLDNFDDRYLGAKASEPSVDNDGDPLVEGALFFDSTVGKMKQYDGSSWALAYNAAGAASAVTNDSGVSGATVKDALNTLDSGKAASSHTHAQSDITGLATALSGKASTSHTHAISDVTGLQDALDDLAEGGGASATEINLLTSNGAYTLVLADAGKTVERNEGSGTTDTIPPNSSVAFPVGTFINYVQTGIGQMTLQGGSGVTLRSRNGLKTAGQWAMVTLYKRGTDEWVVGGDLTA